mmetsp:Transcript_189/g.527  ORF Transcript_189/g.527 Transcript_189/m.527 type:complete len:275 (-) Transcript_189:260-1084(-)
MLISALSASISLACSLTSCSSRMRSSASLRAAGPPSPRVTLPLLLSSFSRRLCCAASSPMRDSSAVFSCVSRSASVLSAAASSLARPTAVVLVPSLTAMVASRSSRFLLVVALSRLSMSTIWPNLSICRSSHLAEAAAISASLPFLSLASRFCCRCRSLNSVRSVRLRSASTPIWPLSLTRLRRLKTRQSEMVEGRTPSMGAEGTSPAASPSSSSSSSAPPGDAGRRPRLLLAHMICESVRLMVVSNRLRRRCLSAWNAVISLLVAVSSLSICR